MQNVTAPARVTPNEALVHSELSGLLTSFSWRNTRGGNRAIQLVTKERDLALTILSQIFCFRVFHIPALRSSPVDHKAGPISDLGHQVTGLQSESTRPFSVTAQNNPEVPIDKGELDADRTLDELHLRSKPKLSWKSFLKSLDLPVELHITRYFTLAEARRMAVGKLRIDRIGTELRDADRCLMAKNFAAAEECFGRIIVELSSFN